MRLFWLSILIVIISSATAFAQRDSPVWEAYLPQISIYHDNDKADAITLDFLFKKNGGPYEHIEHQAYILVYLKKDEDQILKLAQDQQLTNKKSDKSKQLLDVLIDKKLVASLETKAAKLNSTTGGTPRFPDVRGNPKRNGVETLAQYSFPFKFTFTNDQLYHSVQGLAHFLPDNATVSGSTTWLEDRIKLIVFVPVNNSAYATKVSPKLQKTWDFAYSMDDETSILYFRPLPYELGLRRLQPQGVLVDIN